MVQCTICFHWCHAACEGYSKDQYATLVEDPNSVFHCSRCQSGARKPAPRPISEAEAIAEAAAEKAAQMGGTNRLGRRTPGARASASIFDAPVRKTGSMQQLLTEAGLETLERIPTPKSKVRPKSAPKTPRANADDLAVANRALGAGLLRPGLVTNSPKRARSNAAIRASKKARVRTAFQGWGKSLQGAPPLSPTTGLIAPEDRDTSRTGRRLKTPARLVETEHLEGGENDQEGFDNGVAVASTPSWKKKLAASVVAAKLGQLGKVAGKRKRAEAEAADEVIEEEALIGSLVRRLNSPLPRPADTPSKQVAFAVDATQKADASPQRDPPKVVAKQRIRHVAGEGPWCGDRRHPPQAVVRFSSGALCALEACKVCGGLGDRDEDEYLCCVDCGEAYHSFCLEPPLRRNEKSRAFWRCPTCKLCDVRARASLLFVPVLLVCGE